MVTAPVSSDDNDNHNTIFKAMVVVIEMMLT